VINERQAFEIEYGEAIERRNNAIRARDEADAAIAEANREIDIFDRIRKRLNLPNAANGRAVRRAPKQDKTAPRQVILAYISAHPGGLTSEDVVSHSVPRMKSNAADKTTLVRTTLYQLKRQKQIELRDGRYYARTNPGGSSDLEAKSREAGR
jgi:hypothetical protein